MYNSELKQRINQLPQHAKILDAGGWFKPFNDATHVIDLMPWETRRVTLQLEPLPAEKFSRETWYQLNFVQPDLRLPFQDKEFDFSVCSHTLEDLAQPNYLIQELIRVSRAGYIEIPSRFAEQTIGIDDSSSKEVGYSHHHWIVEQNHNKLNFFLKKASLEGDRSNIPLTTYRKLTKQMPEINTLSFFWENSFDVEFITDQTVARARATQFRRSLNIRWDDIITDRVLCTGRIIRKKLNLKQQKNNDWWTNIVEVSRPYSSIPIG